MIEVLDAKKDSYNKQLEELRKRHANEIAEREKILSEYHKTISEIEKKYEEDKRKLTFLEKRKVKQVVKEMKGDPDAIKEKIKDLFDLHDVD